MSTTKLFAGVSYNLPNNREPKGAWGADTATFLQAVADKSLTTAGGSAALTSDINFGTSFGVIGPYFKSSTGNIATTGVIRFGNNEGLAWRNAANSADLVLKVDASNNLTFGGTTLPSVSSKLSAFAATTSSELAGVITDETGTGALVFATSPTLVTPVLGAATATSINKITFTAPATGATMVIADGKTVTQNNTLTYTGTDGSSIAFGTGGTVVYTSNKLSVFAATTSSELAGVISDETGTGSLVFAQGPVLITPKFNTGADYEEQSSTPVTPSAGRRKLYPKSDGWYGVDSSGSVTRLATTAEAFSNPMTTLGDTVYGAASGVATRVAGNATSSRMFLGQTGTGSASAAPAWANILSSDISGLNASQATAFSLTYQSPMDIYISSPAAAINQDLPSTGVLAGQRFRLIVLGATETNYVALRSSAGTEIDRIGGEGFILVQALQATPTTPAHWKLIDLYEKTSFTQAFTWAVGGSTNATVYLSRMSKLVSLSVADCLSAGSVSGYLTGTSAIPTRLRPSSNINVMISTNSAGGQNIGVANVSSSNGNIGLSLGTAGGSWGTNTGQGFYGFGVSWTKS